MRLCPKCSNISNDDHICTNCEYHFLSPEETEIINKYKDFVHSSLDLSPQGKNATIEYFNNVIKMLGLIRETLQSFAELNKDVIIKQKLLNNSKWKRLIQSKLLLINMISRGIDPTQFSQKVIANPPPGTWFIGTKILNISLEAKYLAEYYGKYLEQSNLEAYEKSQKSYEGIQQSINIALDEIKKLTKDLESAPDMQESDSWYTKGATFALQGSNEEAISCFNKALELDPNIASYWNDKGSVLVKLNRESEALKCFEKAIELDSQLEGAWYNKGYILGKGKHPEEAIYYFNKALELVPQDYMAWCNKYLVEDHLGLHKEAIRSIHQFLNYAPAELLTQIEHAKERLMVLQGE